MKTNIFTQELKISAEIANAIIELLPKNREGDHIYCLATLQDVMDNLPFDAKDTHKKEEGIFRYILYKAGIFKPDFVPGCIYYSHAAAEESADVEKNKCKAAFKVIKYQVISNTYLIEHCLCGNQSIVNPGELPNRNMCGKISETYLANLLDRYSEELHKENFCGQQKEVITLLEKIFPQAKEANECQVQEVQEVASERDRVIAEKQVGALNTQYLDIVNENSYKLLLHLPYMQSMPETLLLAINSFFEPNTAKAIKQNIVDTERRSKDPSYLNVEEVSTGATIIKLLTYLSELYEELELKFFFELKAV